MKSALAEMHQPEALPPGDPRKSWWTYADLAVIFGFSTERATRMLVRQLGPHGFPAPLPYHRRELRWNPRAVLAFKARHEAKMGAAPPVALANRST